MTPRPTVGLSVDQHGIRLRGADEVVYDIHFDGRRVWSIDGADLDRDDEGWSGVSWPGPLERQLSGAARVELVEHVSGDTVASTEVVFGTSSHRVSVVGADGEPLALTKWGRLVQPFSEASRESIEAYLDGVEEVLGALRDECAVPAFLSFGSLLGAIRHGGVIPHDVDVDIGYLSAFDNPVDVMLEGFEIERRLNARGFKVRRHNGGFLAMQVRLPDGATRNLDIFTAFVHGGRLYQVNDIDTEADVSAVLPLGSVEFEGRTMPIPRRPTVFLESAYGPDWRTPNPAFSFTRPRRQRRRMRGWFGGLRDRRDALSRHYASLRGADGQGPSPLASWVVDQQPAGPLIDLGCGTGQDAVYFLSRGFDVLAADVTLLTARRVFRSLPRGQRPRTLRINLDSVQETLTHGARLARSGQPYSLVAHSIHLMSDSGRANLWRFLHMTLQAGGKGYVEFRTQPDETLPKDLRSIAAGDLDPRAVELEAARFHLRVLTRYEGRDLPKPVVDPDLCWMIVEARTM